jgi:hypothetical protein
MREEGEEENRLSRETASLAWGRTTKVFKTSHSETLACLL